ncbi:hypothetical protein TrST_g13742 [Triparma strigata]|uniref:Uncharacterized protein n=1 Tax=Triparma strigata TaxID=1606541 RepID=A0A9W7EWK3_9STRA|nr:hypothetical protein TrST_g13742 [Triparma strigata]
MSSLGPNSSRVLPSSSQQQQQINPRRGADQHKPPKTTFLHGLGPSISLLISYLDLVTTVLCAREYFNDGNYLRAKIAISFPMLTLLLHACTTYIQYRFAPVNWYCKRRVALALIGLGPVDHAYNLWVGIEPPPYSPLATSAFYTLIRAESVVMLSIPSALIQAYTLLCLTSFYEWKKHEPDINAINEALGNIFAGGKKKTYLANSNVKEMKEMKKMKKKSIKTARRSRGGTGPLSLWPQPPGIF